MMKSLYNICYPCLCAIMRREVGGWFNAGWSALPMSSRMLSSVQEFQKKITEELVTEAQIQLKENKRPMANYLLDKNISDCVVEKVCDLLPDEAVVLECNPGLGLMTPAFLRSSKASKVIIAEAQEKFVSDMQKWRTKVSRLRVHVEKLNLFTAKRPEEKETLQRLLRLVKPREWEEDPPLSVVGVVPMVVEGIFMTRLLHSLAARDGLFSVGRAEFYLFLSAQQFRNVDLAFPTSDSRIHHMSSILYSLLFDTTYLMQVDKSLFSPPIPSRRRMLVAHPLEASLDNLDPDMMYLVHLKPKARISEEVLGWEELPKFIAFLKQMTRVKRVRLIPKMESWVHGSGVHLILMNYTMMTYVQDLVPAQYVQIYKAMLTWPEYQESNLQLLLEKEVSILQDEETAESGGQTKSIVT